MDINPWEFKADFEKYEFASFHHEKEVSLIIFSSAWLDPNSYQNDEKAIYETLNYLLPF